MGDSMQTDSPLDTVAATVAPATAEAFKHLGNETRLAILLALWDAFEPFNEGPAVSFTDLRKRVGMRDGSQFNYHLDRLVGHFVRHTDDGYKLLPAGLAIVWAVIAGKGLKDPEFEPAELDKPCPYCDAPTQLRYEDAHLVWVCTECEGNGSFDETISEGVLYFTTFAPTGLASRTPDEILEVSFTNANHDNLLVSEGICPSCSGPVEGELLVCDDHDPPPGGLCPTCTERRQILARFTCRICKNGMKRRPGSTATWHPSVVAFYFDRIADRDGRVSDQTSLFQLHREKQIQNEELVSRDPLRLCVTVEWAGDTLDVILDEAVNVVEIRG